MKYDNDGPKSLNTFARGSPKDHSLVNWSKFGKPKRFHRKCLSEMLTDDARRQRPDTTANHEHFVFR